MRRRGRAQDSTEGPDGPRLGYGPSQGDGEWEAALWRYIAGCVPPHVSILPVWSDSAWEARLPVVGRVVPDAVRSGRERLGE